jgi:hypothetical protein
MARCLPTGIDLHAAEAPICLINVTLVGISRAYSTEGVRFGGSSAVDHTVWRGIDDPLFWPQQDDWCAGIEQTHQFAPMAEKLRNPLYSPFLLCIPRKYVSPGRY